jgi:hypothetical protein
VGVYVIRDKLATMPEVASVCLTPDYLGANLRFYNWRTLALADDTTRTIGFSQFFYYQNEHFFETQGLRAIEGSPDAETLSRQIAPDGIVMTRSVAQMLFGHDHVMGKRVAMVDTRYEGGEIVHGVVGLPHHSWRGGGREGCAQRAIPLCGLLPQSRQRGQCLLPTARAAETRMLMPRSS